MNLLGPDLLAEVTLHLTADGHRKVIASKASTQAEVQRQVEGLIMSAVDMAKAAGVGINWAQLNVLYPYRGPAQATPVPPPAPPG